MPLVFDWERRILILLETLPRILTRTIAKVELSGFATREQLTSLQAAQRDFMPMPVGTRWGEMWQYGWFRASVQTPADAAGKRLILRCNPGPEGLAWINGRCACGFGEKRDFIELTRSAKGSERFDVLIEAYAGHGLRTDWTPPAIGGGIPWHDPEGPQCTIPPTTLEEWNEEAYQFYTDLRTLSEVRAHSDPDSLLVADIETALAKCATTVDFELPHDEMMATIFEARQLLTPLLARRNGSSAPTYYCIGHGHLDIAWLWPLQESERKIARTISNTLSLAEEYPEYRFLQSQPHLYWMLQQRYPELYERVKEAVRKGTIVPDGAMWVEPDTNVTGGESLIRQLTHGIRFFREEFGVESRVLWLPDVFGYTGALPQIALGCGIRWFTTAKLTWGYMVGDPYPYNEFLWEGIDGTQLLTHLVQNYNAPTSPEWLLRRWKRRVQKHGYNTMLYPFGYGDGGGGPAREHMEFLRRCKDLEGVPRTKIAAPAEFFENLERSRTVTERYVGELYLQCHRKNQVTQARTKRLNRKAEFALREAELWTTLASALKHTPSRQNDLTSLWRQVLLNQFHDILPGSSIGRVYDEAENSYSRVVASASEIARDAMSALCKNDENRFSVFNSLPWPRKSLVELPEGIVGASGADGSATGSQTFEGKHYAELALPAMGASVFRKAAAGTLRNTLRAEPRLLENEHLRATFNERAEITSLFDKDADRELCAGPCNVMAMFKDHPVRCDAWDLDKTYKEMPFPLTAPAQVEVVAVGPLVAILRVKRKLNRSQMTQEIILRRDSRRLDFRTSIDWRETHKVLKVLFTVDILSDRAMHEIQFGHIERPTHGSRQFDKERFEVAQHKWTALTESSRGFAVLNDCKYSVGVDGKTIGLTLLCAPVAPDRNADKGIQEFTYSAFAWNGPFCESGLVAEAYDLNVPPAVVCGIAPECTFLQVDAQNIVIETVKPAEDGSGDIVLRLYESARTTTRCKLRLAFPFAQAAQTNMLEEQPQSLTSKDGAVALDFRPFEIKTIRITKADSLVRSMA